jgi:glycogen phosphorylase
MLRPSRTFTVVPSLPPRLAPLRELAYNLWWSWNLDVIDLFRRLDRDLWETTGHNPVAMLGLIKQDRIEEASRDEGFMSQLMRVYQALNHYLSTRDTWYQRHYGEGVAPANGQAAPGSSSGVARADTRIAYFSAEYGLNEALPIYSGGLGVLAGDHLKSASDLGLPLVGVGLLYQEGYFRQYLNADGWQQESYPVNDFYTMPLQLERGRDGEPVTVEVQYPGRLVVAQVWRVQVGRVPLYLLDANLPVNRPEDRAITGRLYGGDLDMRIRQEIMLGIGGLRALSALEIEPTVCHMNEGHSAFLALERIRVAMKRDGVSFSVARCATVAGNVFTTHTAVPAGIDLFPPNLMDYYFSFYYQELGLSRDQFLQLGRRPGVSPEENFSMAVLALSLASQANGVSQLHGRVARNMWRDLWPQTPVDEVPITAITNGMHPRSWISSDMASLLVRYLGPHWVERPYDHSVWEGVQRIPDEELWRTHERRRERLVAVARERLRRQLERRGAPQQEMVEASEALDPEALTIVFARRFATYKRALLLFTDPERLASILNLRGRPVQIIFAGKAHPHDNPGKEFIRKLVHLARRDDMRQRVIFIEDYDMSLARYLVQGADVWLNTPRRGLEASGTSGMKAAANGAINLSTLDGWWAEGYSPDLGWAVGHGEVYEDVYYGDEVEARALYDLLEKEVVPLFYARGADGLPREWIARMKRSMSRITPRFNTLRMLEEYAERLYMPAAARYGRLVADGFQAAAELSEWLERVRQQWRDLRIVSVQSDARDGVPVHTEVDVSAEVKLNGLDPNDLLVQVFYGPVGPQGQLMDYEVEAMVPGLCREGACTYARSIVCERSGMHGFAIRVLPSHPELAPRLIPGLVLWSS